MLFKYFETHYSVNCLLQISYNCTYMYNVHVVCLKHTVNSALCKIIAQRCLFDYRMFVCYLLLKNRLLLICWLILTRVDEIRYYATC